MCLIALYLSDMDIQAIEGKDKGKVFIKNGESVLAEMTWYKGGRNYIVLDHTMVDDSLRGQGVGRKLLDQIVNMALERKYKILPECPFVVAMFDRYAEYRAFDYRTSRTDRAR